MFEKRTRKKRCTAGTKRKIEKALTQSDEADEHVDPVLLDEGFLLRRRNGLALGSQRRRHAKFRSRWPTGTQRESRGKEHDVGV